MKRYLHLTVHILTYKQSFFKINFIFWKTSWLYGNLVYNIFVALGNCVTVARQTLTLFVGVRIPIPQPKKKHWLNKSVLLFFLHKTSKGFEQGRFAEWQIATLRGIVAKPVGNEQSEAEGALRPNNPYSPAKKKHWLNKSVLLFFCTKLQRDSNKEGAKRWLWM